MTVVRSNSGRVVIKYQSSLLRTCSQAPARGLSSSAVLSSPPSPPHHVTTSLVNIPTPSFTSHLESSGRRGGVSEKTFELHDEVLACGQDTWGEHTLGQGGAHCWWEVVYINFSHCR